MIPFSKIPLSRDYSNAFLLEFKWLLDDYFAKISWTDLDDKLAHWKSLSKNNRRLVDILHTAIDGYTLDTSKNKKALKKVKTYKIHQKLKKQINDELKSYEMLRSMMSYRFIYEGYGSATDYVHMLKINAMNHGVMDAPEHMQELIKDKFYRRNIGEINKVVASFGLHAFSQVETLYAKRIFPDYNFKREKSLLDIPEHIEKATKLIIEDGKKKTYLKKNSSVMFSKSPSTFELDWQEYRYLALKKYILTLAKSKSKKVKKEIDPKENHIDATVTFSDKEIQSIKKTWGLKDNKGITKKLLISELITSHITDKLATD